MQTKTRLTIDEYEGGKMVVNTPTISMKYEGVDPIKTYELSVDPQEIADAKSNPQSFSDRFVDITSRQGYHIGNTDKEAVVGDRRAV